MDSVPSDGKEFTAKERQRQLELEMSMDINETKSGQPTTKGLLDSGANVHAVHQSRLKSGKKTSRGARSAVGGFTAFTGAGSAIIQPINTNGESFKVTLPDDGCFSYTSGFDHEILSLMKIMQLPKAELKMNSAGLISLQVADDQGEIQQCRVYDSGSLLWVDLLEKHDNCDGCMTFYHCNDCNKPRSCK